MRVAIVGGGVIGLCLAHELRKGGAGVELFERGRCGQAASLGNAGWVTPGLIGPLPAPGVMKQALKWMLDPGSPLLVRPRLSPRFLLWSAQFARNCAPGPYRSGTQATLRLARHAEADFDALRADGVAFEMHDDGLLYLVRDAAKLDEQVETYRELEQMGWDGRPRRLDRDELQALEPAVHPEVPAGLLGERERHVEPGSLTAGLRTRIAANGVTIHEHTEITDLRDLGEYDRVVVAAGAYSPQLLPGLPVEAAKGYSVTATGDGTPPRRPLYLTESKVGATPFEDGFRLAGTLELAGLDLRHTKRRIDAVANAARGYLKEWQPRANRVDWAGLRPMAPDGLPIIGRMPGREDVFVATAHAMLGITLAPSTARQLAPEILRDEHSPDLDGLRPARFAAAA